MSGVVQAGNFNVFCSDVRCCTGRRLHAVFSDVRCLTGRKLHAVYGDVRCCTGSSVHAVCSDVRCRISVDLTSIVIVVGRTGRRFDFICTVSNRRKQDVVL